MDDKGPTQSATALTIPANYQGRLPGLEELRTLAALLVVGLHAGVPYVHTRIIGLSWPTHDSHPSALVDAIVTNGARAYHCVRVHAFTSCI
jgi:peptidoglycan/LPS O-acetylase OafA/YrhL